MGRTLITLCLILAGMLCAPRPIQAASGDLPVAASAGAVRYLVRNGSPLAAAAHDPRSGVTLVMDLPQIGAQVIEAPADLLFAAGEEGSEGSEGSEGIYADVATRPAAAADDPILASGAQWAPQRIQAPQAWDKTGGEGVVVAIVDSGIDPDHPDLRDRLVPGYNFWEDTADTSDRCGHGTHVAGIVAAAAHNGEGIAGIAHDAKLMPVKVMADGCYGTYSKMIAGILYAVDAGARIVVITSGAYVDNPLLHEAVVYARSRGVLVVAAAGNDCTDRPFYPAAYAEAVAVAGADQADAPFIRTNYGAHIDIAAPATDIVSAYWADGRSTYAALTGTSMAAPHVAGVAALALALQPTLSVDALEAVLLESAEDRGAPGWDPYFGNGRANAWQAVQAVLPAGNTATLTMYLPALLGE